MDDIKSYLKSINTLYYALAAGQLFLAAIFVYLNQGEDAGFSFDAGNVFHLIAPIFLMSAIAASFFLYNKKITEGQKLSGLSEKLVDYRTTIIIRSALLEGANLICLVFFFTEKNYLFLFLFFIGMGAFLLVRPSVDHFREAYKLKSEEWDELRSALR